LNRSKKPATARCKVDLLQCAQQSGPQLPAGVSFTSQSGVFTMGVHYNVEVHISPIHMLTDPPQMWSAQFTVRVIDEQSAH
jgi:hypothetical protein